MAGSMVADNLFTSMEQTLEYLNSNLDDGQVEELLKLFSTARDAYSSTVVKRKYLLIVFEGLDGSGKSTMVKLAKKKLGGSVVTTPPKCIQKLRPYFDKCESKLRRAYYSLGNYMAAMEIRSLISTRHVFLDRFWHSTAAYALAESGEVIPPLGHSVFKWPKDLLKPDAIIFLNVEENQRLIRTRSRKETEEEVLLREDATFRAKLKEIYTKMDGITFFESNMPPKAVFKQIMEKSLQPLLRLVLEFREDE